MVSFDLRFGQWVLIWSIGLIFALLAARVGSRSWLLALLLPIVTFAFNVAIIFWNEPN
jgi:hypothetical protein